jgi:hypothetical protein
MDGGWAVRIAAWLERVYAEGGGETEGLARVLEGVTAGEAGWRPVSGQRTIAEIAGHLVHRCRRLLHLLDPTVHPHPGPEPGSEEPGRPEDWESTRERLRTAFTLLAATLRSLPPAALDQPVPDHAGRTWRDVLCDLVVDTAHHAGQIAVLRRWYATQELAV